MSLTEKLAKKKFAYRDVTICLDGELAGEWEKARQNLAGATLALEALQQDQKDRKSPGDTRMSGSPVKAAEAGVASALEAAQTVEERMREASVTIRFTAITFGEYRKFMIQHPARKGKDETFNPETFYLAVARRSGQYLDDDGNPQPISSEEWDELEQVLTDGEVDKIASAIILANQQDSARGLDFTSGGSVKTDVSAENSEPPAISESPTDD